MLKVEEQEEGGVGRKSRSLSCMVDLFIFQTQ